MSMSLRRSKSTITSWNGSDTLSVYREREGRLAALNAQHELHIQELQKKIQQKVRYYGLKKNNWAASWQNQHPPSLISLRCPHEETLGPQLHVELTAKTLQADMSLRWAHRLFCWFCHEAAILKIGHWYSIGGLYDLVQSYPHVAEKDIGMTYWTIDLWCLKMRFNFVYLLQLSGSYLKIRKIRTPAKLVISQKFEQYDLIMELSVQKTQTEWQTVWIMIRRLLLSDLGLHCLPRRRPKLMAAILERTAAIKPPIGLHDDGLRMNFTCFLQ